MTSSVRLRLLVAAVAVGLSPAMPAVAAPRPVPLAPPAAASPSPDSESGAMLRARREHRKVEVGSLTTERRKVVADPETGRFEAQVNANPVRVRRSTGWADLDATLQASGNRLRPKTTEVGLDLSSGGAGPLVSLADGPSSLALTWASDRSLPTPTVRGDKAIYSDVRPGIDLVVQTNAYGFSQYLVVRTRKAAADPLLDSFAFDLSAPGLSVATADGGLEARSPGGDVVFAAPRFQMWGSTGDVPTASSVDASAYVTGSMEHGTTADVGSTLTRGRLTLRPDQKLLADPSVRFPVVIDPSVSRRKSNWAMVWSNGTEFWNPDDDDQSARVGYDGWSGENKKSRVFYTFDTKDLAGKTILSATFTHVQVHSPSYDCDQKTASPAVNLDRSGTISSSTKWPGPSTYDRLDDSKTVAGNIKTCNNPTTQEWDATDGAKDASANAWNTLTVRLASDDESDKGGWRQYKNTSSYPVLSITYDTMPITPGAVGIGGLKTYGGVGYLPSTTPQLSMPVKDPDAGDAVHGVFIVNPIDAAGSNDDRTFIESDPVSSPGIAGKLVSKVVPAGVLANGGHYNIYGRADDGHLQTVSGPATEVWVDTAVPGAPALTGGPTATVAQGTRITFHVDAPEADVASYLYGLNSGSPTTAATPSSLGGAVDVSVVANQFGPNFFTVVSVDRAGNRTATPLRFEFKVDGTLPSDHYRLDRTGTDDRTGAAPGSTGSNLSIPTSPAATWVPGRDAKNDDGTTPRDCTDYALQLTPTGQQSVSTAVGHPLDTSQSFTVSAWLKADDLVGTSSTRSERYAVTMPVGSGAAFSLGYRLDPPTGRVYWLLTLDDPADQVGRTLAPASVPSTGNVVAGRWTHVVGVYDAAAGTASLYVDGRLTASVPVGVVPARGSQLTLGSGPYGSTPLVWNGALDEVSLYQGALSAGQVNTLAGTRRQPGGC